MKIKGVDVRVRSGAASGARAAAVVEEAAQALSGGGILTEKAAAKGRPVRVQVSTAGADGVPDEHSVRAACAAAFSRADSLKLPSIAIPALGFREGGLSPVASGKILVQEALRIARGGKTGLRTIWLCCADKKAFVVFKKAVLGYLEHFLNVLQWGPFVTVDAIIETPDGIVLVERSNPPFGYALPGGFVDYGESLEDAVRREAREETGLELEGLFQFHTYSDPGRDPRFHTVTTVFGATSGGKPRAGDDAASIKVVRPQDIGGLHIAFDHGQVIKDFITRKKEQHGLC